MCITFFLFLILTEIYPYIHNCGIPLQFDIKIKVVRYFSIYPIAACIHWHSFVEIHINCSARHIVYLNERGKKISFYIFSSISVGTYLSPLLSHFLQSILLLHAAKSCVLNFLLLKASKILCKMSNSRGH